MTKPASTNGTVHSAQLAEIERWAQLQKDLLDNIQTVHNEWLAVTEEMNKFAEKNEVFTKQETVNRYVQLTRDRDVLSERVARLVEDYEFHNNNHESIMAALV